MGDILVRVSDSFEPVSLCYDNEAHMIVLPEGTTSVELLCEPKEGFVLLSSSLTLCAVNPENEEEIYESEIAACDEEKFVLSLDYCEGFSYVIEGIEFAEVDGEVIQDSAITEEISEDAAEEISEEVADETYDEDYEEVSEEVTEAVDAENSDETQEITGDVIPEEDTELFAEDDMQGNSEEIDEVFYESVTYDSVMLSGNLSSNDFAVSVGARYNPGTKKPDYFIKVNTTDLYDGRRIVLVEGRDFTVDYGYSTSGNGAVKAKNLVVGNTYYAKITGKGDFKDTIYAGYEYYAAELSTVNLSDYYNNYCHCDFNGKDIDFNPTIICNGYTLKRGTDFVIEGYTPIKEQGAVSDAKIIGINNFKGTLNVQVMVNPADLTKATVKMDKSSYPWGVTPNPTITYNSVKLINGSDYKLEVVDRKVGTSRCKITSLKDLSIYIYVDYKVLPDVDISKTKVSIDSGVYNGGRNVPNITVTVPTSNSVLVNGTHYYTAFYESPINAGTYKLDICGYEDIGFGGKKTVNYTVKPATITRADCVVEDAEYVNSKTTPKPKLTITKFGKTLTEGTDYTLSYGKTNQAGKTNTVTVQGKGNFCGKVTLNYNITCGSIIPYVEECYLANDLFAFESYDAKTIDCSLPNLKYGTDYEIIHKSGLGTISKGVLTFDSAYEACIDYRTVVLEYVGIGNYTGKLERSFKFTVLDTNKGDLKNCRSYFDQTECVFTGYPIESPLISLYNGNNTLISDYYLRGTGGSNEGFDYALTYKNNINVGTATVTATGANGWKGSVSKNFKIIKATPEDSNVVLDILNGEKPYINNSGKLVLPSFKITYRYNYYTSVYELKQGVDYTYKINPYKLEDGTDISINVTFKGNFESKTLTFGLGELEVINLNDYIYGPFNSQTPVNYRAEEYFQIKGKAYTFTGAPIKVSNTLTYCGPSSNYKKITLKEGTDFEVTYIYHPEKGSPQEVDCLYNAGYYAIKIKGKGKYKFVDEQNRNCFELRTGQDYVNYYNVLPADASKMSVSLNKTSFKYNPDICNLNDAQAQDLLGSNNIKSIKLGKNVVYDNNYEISVINCRKPGTATLSIKGKNNLTGTYVKNITIDGKVDINDVVIGEVPASAPLTPAGAQLMINPTYMGAKLELNKDYKIEYKNNTAVSNGNQKAKATIKGVGKFYGTYSSTYEFTVTSGDLTNAFDSNYYYTSDKLKLFSGELEDGTSNPDLKGDFLCYATTYTGKAVSFDPKIKQYGKELKLGTDYTIEYVRLHGSTTETQVRDVNFYRCYIVGKGKYTGKSDKYFILAVAPADINKVNIKVTDTYYTGYSNDPVLTYTYNGVKLDPSDFSLSYCPEWSNPKFSTYDAKFNSWLSKEFKVVYKSCNGPSSTYTDYKSAGDYTIEVDGNNFYGYKKATFKVKGVDISKAKFGTIAPVQYDNASNPRDLDSLKITYNGYKMKLSTDYEYKVLTPTFASAGKGKGTVLITGKGKYCGTKKMTYDILPKDVSKDSNLKVEVVEGNYTYSGKAFTPEVKVSYKYNYFCTSPVSYNEYIDLVKGKDYTVSYSNNTNSRKHGVSGGADNEAVITITFKGNYSGTVIKKFCIECPTVSYDNVTLTDAKVNNYKSVPSITVNGKKLVNGQDFTCKYYYNQFGYFKKKGVLKKIIKGDEVGKYDQVLAGICIKVEITIINDNYTNYGKSDGKLSMWYNVI